MYYVAFVSVNHSGNEAPEMCDECLRVPMSHMSNVKCSVTKKKNVMKVALPAVKRIQCSVEAQIQLAFVGAMKW